MKGELIMDTNANLNTGKGLDVSKFAAVNALEHAPGRSDRYTFIPTTRVIDILANQGWYPAKVQEKRANKVENRGFQTHIIRFRQEKDLPVSTPYLYGYRRPAVVDSLIPEIVLKNAHDGTAAYELMAGIFRVVCTNGMIVADSMFAKHKIKHIGFQDQNVIEAVYDVVKTTPAIMGRIGDFRAIELDKPEQILMGQAALMVKYGEEGGADVRKYDPEELIRPIRREDRLEGTIRNSLWNVFQTLQEKTVEKGGRFARDEYGRRRKARAVASVSENVRINQGLWMLAEKMAELKGAAFKANLPAVV